MSTKNKLQLREGSVSPFQCRCSRKTKVLRRWTDSKLSIVEGETVGWKLVDNAESKGETVLEFADNGNTITVGWLEDDPNHPDKFLGVVINNKAGKSLATFQMKDIVQQRWFMASLGATGRGLFSPKLGIQEKKIEQQWSGIWDETHAVDVHTPKEKTYFGSDSNPPPYTEEATMLYIHEPTYQSVQDIKQSISGQLQRLQEGQTVHNRQQHDTFLPPLGPPVHVFTSIGYGQEIDLQPGVQELWDPVKKSRLFFDHNQQKTYYQDPRPSKPSPIRIECKHIVYGPDRKDPRIIQTNQAQATIDYHTERAYRKKNQWGATIIAKGRDGAQGRDGHNGAPGCNGLNGAGGITTYAGFPGSRGQDGFPGRNGWPGQNGGEGGNGSNGSDLSIFLSGDTHRLQVSGSYEGSIQLGGEQCEYILFVDCTGGNGGSGGRGGSGGNGGQGGEGGNGGSGGPGQHGGTSQHGGNGGNGGDGGNGGPGGIGGYGGNGGKGGSSGNGGLCAVQSYDARLIHLVEVACGAGRSGNSGTGGKAGFGGIGGLGGNGGFGGVGGRGGPNSDHSGFMPYGNSGNVGNSGSKGPDGYQGQNGGIGTKGNEGLKGGLSFVVLSPDGQRILEQSAFRYDVEIDPRSVRIATGVDDGIIEPNEKIIITSFNIQNIGSMTLPDGALAYMVSSKTVNFHPMKVALPPLRQQETHTVLQEFYGRVFDVPPPNKPGPYIGEAHFETRVDLLGRPFDSAKTMHTLVVQYPIKIDNISSPENLGRGEQGRIDITIANISNLPYGNFSGSGGQLSVRVRLDKRLSPIANPHTPYTNQFSIHHDANVQDSFFVDIIRIESAGKVTITFNLAVSNRADLFERCPIQTEIILRGKLIEYHHCFVRVTPFYIPSDPPADVLFITDQQISRREFILWQRLFQLLRVRVDFWDREKYGGISYNESTGSRHKVSWVGRHGGSLIIYPNAFMNLVNPDDLIEHLNDNRRDVMEQVIDNDSGVIFIQSSRENEENSRRIKSYIKDICNAGQKITLEGKDYGGKHMSGPATHDFKSKRSELVKSLEEQSPNTRCYVTTHLAAPRKLKLLSYTYGSVEINRFPIEQTSKFMIVARDISKFLSDDVNMSVGQMEIPLANNWAQTLTYVIYGLPTKVKFGILQGHIDSDVRFITPSGYKITIVDIAQLALTKEILAEVKCLRMQMPKLAALSALVLENLDSFVRNTEQVFGIITAVKIFAKERIPSKQKEIKLRVLEYCRQVKRKLISFGGKSVGKQFNSVKCYSVKGKRLYFEDLISQDNTFEPHLRNDNEPNNEYDLTL
ncbi:hypothetical protein LOD99_14153 [Oopsacas minuta]|uniref:DUF7932 domain-containing protein n=1 Tax=Oopsacas minuta TaxID=111878 RepID=A0AAV7KHH4_9METZ|nr:hypothetical protein LOD99_14153 [Oopsacas minuta]